MHHNSDCCTDNTLANYCFELILVFWYLLALRCSTSCGCWWCESSSSFLILHVDFGNTHRHCDIGVVFVVDGIVVVEVVGEVVVVVDHHGGLLHGFYCS